MTGDKTDSSPDQAQPNRREFLRRLAAGPAGALAAATLPATPASAALAAQLARQLTG